MNAPRILPADRVAIFVDGENVSHRHAPAILAAAPGERIVARVYGAAVHLDAWSDAPAFEPILSAMAGRNAADITLCVDAMDVAHRAGPERVVLVSSDRDFGPLARRLRQCGIRVLGLGEAKAPRAYRECCTAFLELAKLRSKAPCLESDVRHLLEAGPTPLSALGIGLRSRGHEFRTGTRDSLTNRITALGIVTVDGGKVRLS